MTRRGHQTFGHWQPEQGWNPRLKRPSFVQSIKQDFAASQWPGEDGESSRRQRNLCRKRRYWQGTFTSSLGGQKIILTALPAAPLRKQRNVSSLLITSSSKTSFNFMHHPFFLKQRLKSRFFFSLSLVFFFFSKDLWLMLKRGFFNFRIG